MSETPADAASPTESLAATAPGMRWYVVLAYSGLE